MKRVLIFIENGFEEVEALAPVDLLRRAGAEVVLATSSGDLVVKGRNNISVVCDQKLAELSPRDFDLLILPGGAGGVEALAKNPQVLETIRTRFQEKKPLGAICAAPLVLKAAGVLQGQKLTSYPSARDELSELVRYSEERVVKDDFLITSRGPGTAVEFGIALVEKLFGKEAASRIAAQIVA